MSATTKIPMDIRFSKDKGEGDKLTVEISGEPGAIIHALIHGLPLEALEQLNAVLDIELAKRRNS